MKFRVIKRDHRITGVHRNVVFLRIDHWNDYSFVTLFHMFFYDDQGNCHDIGNVKIGFKGQTAEKATYERLDETFDELTDDYFSLGDSTEFYKVIASLGNLGLDILTRLKDLASNPSLIDDVRKEEVFSVSLLRGTSLSVIKGQYQRVLSGGNELTDYEFSYKRDAVGSYSSLELDFDVVVGEKPSTNIHAIIGRNGVGKTTLLNDMINAVIRPTSAIGKFIDRSYGYPREIDEAYFSSLISVSFSAFDPFVPPVDRSDPAMGACYYYIGLKDAQQKGIHRDIESLQWDCCRALVACFNDSDKDKLWCQAIEDLGYDENFSSANLVSLRECFFQAKKTIAAQVDSSDFKKNYLAKIEPTLNGLSSGHAIVLLTITRLVATVQEKTLVLIDEPESHLHPPLLAAFVRALSELLLKMNGVSIIATHSPVVLQEIPKGSVYKVYRQGANTIVDRPNIETFAENLGVLTSEVFGLEVEQSGFHNMLKGSVAAGQSYKSILNEYHDQIGFEGRAILKALIAERDRS